MAKICQLYSGSSGNSVFVGNGSTKLLIDAGVSAKRLEEGLAAIGEDASALSAILVTHEHADHVAGLRVLASRHGIPVFTSEKIAARLWQDNRVSDKVTLETISPHMELGGIDILPFQNSHDSVECYGYRLTLPGGRSMAVCTDTGYITPEARKAVAGVDLIFLESNHEVMMLQNGPYRYMLKQRILSRVGHLSNDDCAAFARELAEKGTARFVLAHLSKENNHPDIARQATLASLTAGGFAEGKDFRLAVSPPVNDTHPIIL